MTHKEVIPACPESNENAGLVAYVERSLSSKIAALCLLKRERFKECLVISLAETL